MNRRNRFRLLFRSSAIVLIFSAVVLLFAVMFFEFIKDASVSLALAFTVALPLLLTWWFAFDFRPRLRELRLHPEKLEQLFPGFWRPVKHVKHKKRLLFAFGLLAVVDASALTSVGLDYNGYGVSAMAVFTLMLVAFSVAVTLFYRSY